MARIGGAKSLRARPWIEIGGDGSSSGMPSAGPWVKGRGWSGVVMGVEAEELIVLLFWSSSSTLRSATQVLGQINLRVNCRSTSTTDCLLVLHFEVRNSKAWGLGGGIRPAETRLQASLSFPQTTLSSPEIVVATSWGVGTCKFLRSQSSHHPPPKIPVLANNMAVQGGEERPRQNGLQVLPIPKGQVRQVCVIVQLHSCRSPRGCYLGRGF